MNTKENRDLFVEQYKEKKRKEKKRINRYGSYKK